MVKRASASDPRGRDDRTWRIVERHEWMRDPDLRQFGAFLRVIDSDGRFFETRSVKGAHSLQFFAASSPPDLEALAEELGVEVESAVASVEPRRWAAAAVFDFGIAETPDAPRAGRRAGARA